MRCTKCNDREAILENLTVFALHGSFCRQCLAELLMSQMAGQSPTELGGLAPEQVAEGLIQIGQRQSEVLRDLAAQFPRGRDDPDFLARLESRLQELYGKPPEPPS